METSVFMRLGLTATRDPADPILLDPFPEICAFGAIRPAVLVLIVDMMGGFIAEEGADGDWVFTTDLSLRAPLARIPRRVEARGTLLRRGRGSISCEVALSADGAPFAHGQTGFIRMPRRHGDPPHPHQHEGARFRAGARIDVPLPEACGIQVIDPATGHVELELLDTLRNPAGALQGAIVSLLAEVSAEELAAAHLRRPCRVADVDIRYLAMARVGPVRARAWWIGPPEAGSIRVELRDRGNDDRLTAAVLLRVVSAAPGA